MAIARPDKAALPDRVAVLPVRVVQRAKRPVKARALRKEGQEWIKGK
jgi:hypothetical protein